MSMPASPNRPDLIIEPYKHDVDRTLLRENLKLLFEERIRKLTAMGRFREELQAGVKEAHRGRDDDTAT